MLLVNFLTLVTEFAGISLAVRQTGISPAVAVPTAALALVALVSTGSYRRWERMTIVLCLLNVSWLGLAFLTHPNGAEVTHHLLRPNLPPGGLTSSLMFMIIGIVGTTIAPWQLFFQQSCVADKKLRFSDLKWARLDTFLGAILTVVVAGCMMLVGDLAFRHRLPFSDPAQMVSALGVHVGPAFKTVFLMLMVDAAILGATAISLSSSWAYGEVRGWTHSLERKVSDARGFYGVYLACVGAAAFWC